MHRKLDELLQVVTANFDTLALDLREAAPDCILHEAFVGPDDERRPRREQEQLDGLQRFDDGVGQAAVEVVHDDNEPTDVGCLQECLEIIAEITDGSPHLLTAALPEETPNLLGIEILDFAGGMGGECRGVRSSDKPDPSRTAESEGKPILGDGRKCGTS